MSHYGSDDDIEEERDPECESVMSRLRGSLFRRNHGVSQASAEERSDNVAQYAVTINPDPHMLFNKRPYHKYNYDQQRAMLTRIENACRRDLGSAYHLLELHFEICPTLNQVHFHALYESSLSMAPYELYMGSRCKRTNAPSWRFYDCQQVYNKSGWLDYIRKNSN